MRTAIYIRVSSKQQDTASQEPDLKRWTDAHGGECIIYRDKFSGKTMDRPGWNKLERAMREGKVDRVVCWRLDRLGRTAKGLTALFAELIEHKINLVSIKDGVDLNTPAGRLMAHVLASVAQYETEVRAERVRAGQAIAKANGKAWGGSERGRRVVVEDEQLATIQRMAADAVAAGTKPRVSSIARATGLSRPTVYAYLPKSLMPIS